MNRHGFIRNKDDIQFLILYALSHVKIQLTFEQVFDICSWCDDGFGYFEFNEAFLELIKLNHIEEPAKGSYVVTEKGCLAALEFRKKLPASIRDVAKISALRVVKEIHRNASLSTSTTEISTHDFIVNLEMDQVFSINMHVASTEQAQMLEYKFKNHAEKIFDNLLDILTKEY